jgi:amino acid transporter
VAIFLFIFHLISLTVLCSFCIYFIFSTGFGTFLENFNMPVKHGSVTLALLFGFSAALLGISGFESSANFVEEQKKGVFPKTLRNMWIVVSIFNPLIAFLALAILTMDLVANNQDAFLSFLGEKTGGHWLSILIGVDAALVLSGAVLTSFVGVEGLMKRMALDRILPKFLLKKNKTGSTYLIPIIFGGLCISILFVTQGDIEQLAGVYTIAFLAVMILFGIGNMLLKIKRKRLPRPERASWFAVIVAVLLIAVGLIGNINLNPGYLLIFAKYLIPTLLVVFFMLYRDYVLGGFLRLLKYLFPEENKFSKYLYRKTIESLANLKSQEFVFFTNHENVETLNKVMLYIKKNEPTKRIKICAVLSKEHKLPLGLKRDIDVLDRAYPDIQIELVEEPGKFGPAKIKELSKRWNIPTNFMFIGAPGEDFRYKIEQLGEVRLII